MMFETKKARGIVSRPTKTGSEPKPALRLGYSINPVPAMLIFLLGTILGGHHQNSMESTMMHKWVFLLFLSRGIAVNRNQFGYLLTGAAITRCVTYLLLYISPPTSTRPSHPPFEPITAFCLMSGGIMLMASVSDLP